MKVEQVRGGIPEPKARRRRLSWEEKRTIVELSLDPDWGVVKTASRCGVRPKQIYAWRRELREMTQAAVIEEAAMFLPAVIEPEAATTVGPESMGSWSGQQRALLPDALVQVAMDVRGVPVLVAHGANPALVASVIAALKRAR